MPQNGNSSVSTAQRRALSNQLIISTTVWMGGSAFGNSAGLITIWMLILWCFLTVLLNWKVSKWYLGLATKPWCHMEGLLTLKTLFAWKYLITKGILWLTIFWNVDFIWYHIYWSLFDTFLIKSTSDFLFNCRTRTVVAPCCLRGFAPRTLLSFPSSLTADHKLLNWEHSEVNIKTVSPEFSVICLCL